MILGRAAHQAMMKQGSRVVVGVLVLLAAVGWAALLAAYAGTDPLALFMDNIGATGPTMGAAAMEGALPGRRRLTRPVQQWVMPQLRCGRRRRHGATYHGRGN